MFEGLRYLTSGNMDAIAWILLLRALVSLGLVIAHVFGIFRCDFRRRRSEIVLTLVFFAAFVNSLDRASTWMLSRAQECQCGGSYGMLFSEMFIVAALLSLLISVGADVYRCEERKKLYPPKSQQE